ncbi:hypothetical protein PRZ48_004241 [Zasmidium cellare]|uniref:NAD(P)-binding protein n=1 Tax=Zasmidium cellare TaxID=395010 RepID=A0ABR0DX95_ZASCE|nr:hypothetical protein PRZ48_015297 [Zasmidium cellare]KAK4503326.1 hypothetical protein PRZ48_004241 [Zasmidium cellare]
MKIRDLNTQDLQEHMVSNVYGVVWLYQATRALLEKSSNGKFATIGSMAGFLENQPPYFSAAYGPSKTAVHWMTKRIDGEEEKITAFVLDPGFVDTDMARKGAEILGVSLEGLGALTPEQSANGIKAVVDGASKEQTGGQMWNFKGEEVAW